MTTYIRKDGSQIEALRISLSVGEHVRARRDCTNLTGIEGVKAAIRRVSEEIITALEERSVTWEQLTADAMILDSMGNAYVD